MRDQMQAAMREATRLTRAGRLAEASALIQQALGGATNPGSTAPPQAPTPVIIEGTFRVHEPTPPQASPREETSRRVHPPLPPRPPTPSRGSVGPGRARRSAPPAPVSARAPSDIPAGARFLSGSYSTSAGARSYKVYVPSGYHGQALPLVVMLHGCTQTPDDFAAGTGMNELAEEQLFLVAYPAQAAGANHSRCWNWFQAADQQRERGEPALIAGITRQIVQAYHLDARRVYVAGLSAGGAMAVIMGAAYPDVYAAVGVHSGLPYGVAHDLPTALAAMHRGGTGAPHATRGHAATIARVVPTIVFHGDQDTTVHQRNGEEVIAQAVAHRQRLASGQKAPTLQMQTQQGQVAGGHAYTRVVYRDARGQAVLEQWLIHGAGHAWSGGNPRGSFTDPGGPNASREMMRFFEKHGGTEAL